MNKNEAKKKRLQKYFANSIQLVYNSIQLSKYLLAFLYLSSLLRLQEIEKKTTSVCSEHFSNIMSQFAEN